MKACYFNFKNINELNANEVRDVLNLSFNNSAFMWGESVFTTGLVKEGKMTLVAGHQSRIEEGYLWLTGSKIAKGFFDEVKTFLEKVSLGETICFRFAFFKGTEETVHHVLKLSDFAPKKELTLYSTQIPNVPVVRPRGVKVGFYGDTHFTQRELDQTDLCFIGNNGEVIESQYSSIILRDTCDRWVLPVSSSYQVESVGVICGLKNLDYVREQVLLESLNLFSAAFCVNAVQGPVPIVKIDDINFARSLDLKDELSRVWCDD